MISVEQEKIAQELVQEAIKKLAPAFDTIQIFVTLSGSDGKDTMGFSSGKGNTFARYGQVKLWADEQFLPEKGEE